MKSFASWVMQGRMQAVIATTVLAVVALIVTPLALFSAAVVMLAMLRQGWREGLFVVSGGLLAITGLGGLLMQMPLAFALVGLTLWFPAAALGAIMGRTGSLRIATEAAAIGAVIIVFVQYLMLPDPAAFWREALSELLRQRVEAEALQQADLDAIVGIVAGWMPGGVAAAWFVGTFVSLVLAKWWSSLIDGSNAFAAEFRELRFGRWLLIVVPLLLVGGVLISGGAPNILSQLYIVGMMVFLIQGLSVAHAIVARFDASVAWLFGLYMMLLLVAPQGATVVAVAGYADGWLDFRSRLRARSPGDGD